MCDEGQVRMRRALWLAQPLLLLLVLVLVVGKQAWYFGKVTAFQRNLWNEREE